MSEMGQTQPTWLGATIHSCPLCSKRGDPNVFSVNTLFWKIRVTRVQQKIFLCEFPLPIRYFEPSCAPHTDYGSTTILTTR
jgi:hypothetical protein